MNIFVLDRDPAIAATMLTNAHVCIMAKEAAQLLCDAHHATGTKKKYPSIYKPLKKQRNHCCARWVRESKSNYLWCAKHCLAICHEYTYRYGKVMTIEQCGLVKWLLENPPDIPDIGLTEFALAIQDMTPLLDPVETYREYYRRYKRHLFHWKNRLPPKWVFEK